MCVCVCVSYILFRYTFLELYTVFNRQAPGHIPQITFNVIVRYT